MMVRVCGLILGLFLATGSIAAEINFFTSNDASLRYFVAGEGDTVVLLHGFSGSAEGLYLEPGTFEHLVAAGFQVVALDQIGHGGSDKPTDPDRYGMQMVEDVRRLLDHLGVEKVHLAGYSMGAKVSNTFRSLYPERLHTLILGGYGWPWQSRQMSYAESLERIASRTVLPGNDLQALAAVSVGMPALTPDDTSLRENSIPTLGIIGDKDTVVSADDLQAFRDTMANMTLVIMPGTHAGPDGAPYKPRYARELVEFLKQHR